MEVESICKKCGTIIAVSALVVEIGIYAMPDLCEECLEHKPQPHTHDHTGTASTVTSTMTSVSASASDTDTTTTTLPPRYYS